MFGDSEFRYAAEYDADLICALEGKCAYIVLTLADPCS